MKTAVLYHRVSTSDQDPTLARAELGRAAELRGLAVVETIEETGSGARNDRPGLQRVLDLALSGQVSHVLVWKLDRFGRGTLDLLANIDTLKRWGVTFVATSQGLEAGPAAGAMGDLLLNVLAAVAQFERDMISERTRLGLAAARAKGKRIGRPPVPVTGAVVARALALLAELPHPNGTIAYDQRRTQRQVLAKLKREGWGEFDRRTLMRALRGAKTVQGYVPAVPAAWRADRAGAGDGQK